MGNRRSLVRKSDIKAMFIRVPRCRRIQPLMNSTLVALRVNMSWATRIKWINDRSLLLMP
ncbi:MAG: hypothetical protein BWY72_01927 [Bacteroidetes bacterium ADurb.Bin416]|nr:MAG: hypothetical protein BWY72_01927 [Bacteroidetes bacterium ADurb.Bin416]